ncbi:wibg [Drosophila busckii]|uniref:Wibg n=1 Tax=Drosophila busckii TaxID=30019 RepID=A0A0M4EXA7_DROBS|nr:benign gonial cell neoplasm protein [Drosophila busckii]ALC42607.1 wibg [Drosophila busckii]
MDQIILNKFIPQQLLYFIAGRRCCQQFACTFRSSDHDIITASARSLGLRVQYMSCSGQARCVKVFKQSCKHYLEEPKALALSHPTIMDMLALLSRSDTFADKEVIQLSEDFMSQNWHVKVPPHSMKLLPLSPPTPHFITEKHRNFIVNISAHATTNKEILTTIYSHRIVVFDADLSWDKTLFLPLIILEDSEVKKSNLKIICVEREEVIAMYNSERLAEYISENVGETVGIQLPLSNNISSITHIVFSTAKHFLRSLINKNSKKFNYISHIVINDIHLHDPYNDILLCELKQALSLNQNLRVVLLSQSGDSQRLLQFFDEGAELSMDKPSLAGVRISYLEDIQSCILLAGIHRGPEIYKDKPQVFRNKNQRNEQMDKCLEVYEELGTDTAIRPFIYAINYELVPVNYQHSITGKTAILIAAQHSNANHLRLLLFMGANPYIVNEQHDNAVTIAAFRGNSECMDILNNYSLHGYVVKNARPEFVDYDLIIDIMYFICTKVDILSGNVLIILPTYYHMVKLNYMLLSHFLTGNLREFAIYTLHEDMDSDYVSALARIHTEGLKLVLSTDVIESLPLPVAFRYVIDTVCQKNTVYDSKRCSTEEKYEWVAKERLLRREAIFNAKVAGEVHHFRLISKEAYEILNDSSRSTLQTLPLDKICLLVKLLSPNTIISEYLTFTIAPPPLLNVHHAVQFLKKIEVLDDAEDVTWLGCRLIDIPVTCQLGRTLIFGILLQCLDPILIIVSSLITTDPLGIPYNEDIDYLWDRFTIYIQNRIKNERARLAADQFSDHFIFVRLFEEWQSRLKSNVPALYLTDEYDFVLNGLMEKFNLTRARIVSALRGANLIHSQGQLSIQNVNMHSAYWPLVKAALTGGLYPNICAVDAQRNCLKSSNSINVHMHPNTVLRGFLEPLNTSAQKFCTTWIVCNKHKDNITYATLIVPLTLAMFAGSSHLGFGQVSEIHRNSTPYCNNLQYFIDEWIWMVVSKPTLELILKIRHLFFKYYQYLLKYCTEPHKWRSESPLMMQYQLLLETLSKVFENEDANVGFNTSPNICFRPAIKLPSLYLLAINTHFVWHQRVENKHDIAAGDASYEMSSHFVEKQFFLLYTEDSPSEFYQKSNAAYIESVIGKFARPIESPNRHIYVILYSKNPDIMLSISRAKTQKIEFVLKEYFRNTVPVTEILEACNALNVNVPSFDGRLMSSLIDKRVGNIIMDLFAFRHHWIHK